MIDYLGRREKKTVREKNAPKKAKKMDAGDKY